MKPVVPAAFHNRVLQAAQEKSLLLEDKLVAVLIPVLTGVANDAADNFERVATKSLISSARRDADMRILGQLGPVASRSLVASLGLVSSVAPNSTMIAVKPTPEQAEALAMAHPDATEPDDLHVTLAFLGHFDGDLQEIADALQPVASAHAPLEGKVGGVGRFADNGKGAPSIVLPSVPGLVELRVAVTQALVDSNLDYGREHGYQPHMTILYDKEGTTLPAQDSMNQPLNFNDLLIVRGNTEQVALPLVGAKPLTAAATATVPDDLLTTDPVRQLLSAEAASADEAVQKAQSKIETAQEHLANAVHDGDATAIEAAKKEIEQARANYRRKLQSARDARKKFESLTPATPGTGTEQTPSGSPSGQITAPSEKVKQVSDATDKTTEQIEEEKKARRAAAARARADGRAGDDLNQEATSPTEGDFSTGASEGIDLTGADSLAAERQRLAQIAAQSFAAWPPPVSSEVIDVAALEEVLHQKMGPVTEAAAHNVIQSAIDGSGIPNLSFDITNPLAGRVLARSASQIVNISQTTQADVMAVIKEAHDTGLSIPATASLIRSKMIEATPARARLIARTELAGAVNGGSLAATQIVAKASGDTYTKQWLTAPGAHYPRHEDYPGLDEQTAPLDGTFVVGDADLKFPGDPDGPPEEVCNCRCTLVYIQGHVPYTNDMASTAPPPEQPTPAPVVPEATGPVLPPNIEQELAQGRAAPGILDEATPDELAAAQAPFKTIDDGEASNYLDKHYAKWGDALDKPELDALDSWQRGYSHEQIERYLHNGVKDYIESAKYGFVNRVGIDQGYGAKFSEEVAVKAMQDTLGEIDGAIEAAPALDQGIETMVFRGSSDLNKELGKGYKIGSLTPVEKNYTAVTTERDVAEGYMPPPFLKEYTPGLIKIELPPGDKGAWLRGAGLEKGLDAAPNHELLLARDRRFVVTDISETTVKPPTKNDTFVTQPYRAPLITLRPYVPGEGSLPPAAAEDLAKGKVAPAIVNEATSGEIAGIPGSQADLGITPFVGPRGDQPGDNPIGFYDSAKFQRFTKDIYSIAPEYGVTVDGFDRTHGVWDGGSEPSVALHAHDGVIAMRAYAARIGKLYEQEGVVIFDNVSSDGDLLATFRKSYKPEEYDAVVKDMADSGLYGGRFTTDGKFQVSGGGTDFVDSVNKLSDTLGVGYDAQHGGFTLLEDQPAPDSIGISYQQVTDAYTEASHAGEAGGFAPVPVDSAGPIDGLLRAEPGGAGGVEVAAQTAPAAAVAPPIDYGDATDAERAKLDVAVQEAYAAIDKAGIDRAYPTPYKSGGAISTDGVRVIREPEGSPGNVGEGGRLQGNTIEINVANKDFSDAAGYERDAKAIAEGDTPTYQQVNLADLIIHEEGHELFQALPAELRDRWTAFYDKWPTPGTGLGYPSYYAQEQAQEAFSETFVAFVRGRADQAPLFQAEMGDILKERGILRAGELPSVVAEDLAKAAIAPQIVDEAQGFEKFGPLPGAVAPKFKLIGPGEYDTEDGRMTLYRLEGASPPAWNVEWTTDYENEVGDTQPDGSPITKLIVDGAASKKDALALFAERWPETRANILKFEQAPLTEADAAAMAEEAAKLGQNPFDAVADLHETLPPRTDAAIAEAAGSPAKDVATVEKPNPVSATAAPDFQQMKMLSTSATPDAQALDKKFVAGLPVSTGLRADDALSEYDNRVEAKAKIAEDLSSRLEGNPVWDSYVREGTVTLGDSGLQVGDTWVGPDGTFTVVKLPVAGILSADKYGSELKVGDKFWANGDWTVTKASTPDADGLAENAAGETKEIWHGGYYYSSEESMKGGGDSFLMKPKSDNADWYDESNPDKTYDFTVDTPFASTKFAPLTGEGETGTIKAAAGLIDNWAGTASDSNPWALALQHAAEKEFGLPDASFERSLHSSDSYSVSQADQIFQAHGPALQAFVRAQYDATQEWLKLNFPGQDKLILYRGQGIGGIHALGDEGAIDTGELDLQPMSSFSYTATTALNFVPAGSESALLGMEVPFDRIMATARTGFGCLNENEFVVLGEPGGVTDQATIVTGRFTAISDAAFRGARAEKDNAFWSNAYNQEAIRSGPEPPTGNSFAYRRPDTGVATAFKITSDVNADGLREITDAQTGEKIMVPAPAVKAAAYTNDVSGGKRLDYSEVQMVTPLEDALLQYGAKVQADVLANPLTEGGLPKVGARFEHPTMPADADGYRTTGQWRVIKVNEDGTTLVRNMEEGTEYNIPTQDVVTALKVNPIGTKEAGGGYKAVTPIASIEKAISPRGTAPALGSELKVGDQFKQGGETWTVMEAPSPTQYGYAKIAGKPGQMPLDEAKTYSKFAENVAPATGKDFVVGDQYKWNDHVYTVTKLADPATGKGEAHLVNADGSAGAKVTWYDSAIYDKVNPLAAPVSASDDLVGKHFYAPNGNEYKVVEVGDKGIIGEDLNGQQIGLPMADATNKIAEWEQANASTSAELVGKHLTYVGKEFEVVQKIGPQLEVKLLEPGEFQGATYKIPISAGLKGIEEYEQKLTIPDVSSLPAGALVNGSELSVGDLINHEGQMWQVQEVPTSSYKGVAVPVNTDTGKPTNSTTTLLLNKDNSYEKAKLFDPNAVAPGVQKGDSFQHVTKEGITVTYHVTGKGLDANSVQVANDATGEQWVVPAKPVADSVANGQEWSAANKKLQEHLG